MTRFGFGIMIDIGGFDNSPAWHAGTRALARHGGLLTLLTANIGRHLDSLNSPAKSSEHWVIVFSLHRQFM